MHFYWIPLVKLDPKYSSHLMLQGCNNTFLQLQFFQKTEIMNRESLLHLKQL